MVTCRAKRQVRVFFFYVIVFYSFDDVFDPLRAEKTEPFYMMAHAAHFVMLLDFAGFFPLSSGPASVGEGAWRADAGAPGEGRRRPLLRASARATGLHCGSAQQP